MTKQDKIQHANHRRIGGVSKSCATGLAAIGSKVPFIIPGESVNATLVLNDALPQCYCCLGMFCGFDTSTQPELFPVKS